MGVPPGPSPQWRRPMMVPSISPRERPRSAFLSTPGQPRGPRGGTRARMSGRDRVRHTRAPLWGQERLGSLSVGHKLEGVCDLVFF